MTLRAKQIGSVAAGFGLAGAAAATSTGAAGDLLMVGEDQADGRAFTLDARSGQFRWLDTDMNAEDAETLAGLNLSAALSRDGAASGADGTFRVPALSCLESLSGTSAHDPIAYVDGVGLVERLGQDQRVLLELDQPIQVLVPWIEDGVVIGVAGTQVFAIDVADRSILCRYDIGELISGGSVEGARILEDGRVACVSRSGQSSLEVLTLDLTSGCVEVMTCRDIPVQIGSIGFAESSPTPASMMMVFAAAAGARRRISGQREESAAPA